MHNVVFTGKALKTFSEQTQALGSKETPRNTKMLTLL
jgi:hypothetical protein